MAEEQTVYVFSVRGADSTKREIQGIASGFDSSQKAADKLATALDHTKKYLSFAEGIKSSADFAAKMKEFPQLMTKLNAELRTVTDIGIRGMGKGINELTKEQQANVAQLRVFSAEYQKTHGLSAGVSAGIENVTASFASMFSVVGLTTVAIGLITKLAGAVKNLAEESLKLGRAEELSEARLVAITGSAKEGKEAWKLYDETVRDTSASMATFSEKDYSAAVARGGIEMGKAYLDASKAFEATGRSADTFMNQILRLEQGMGVMKRSMAKYSDVVKEAGLDINKLVKNEYDAHEAATALRGAIDRMAQSQEKVTGPTGIGMMNRVKNMWDEIKETIGRVLNEVLKPIAAEILKIFKGQEDWNGLIRFAKENLLPIVKLIVLDIVIAIKEIAFVAKIINGAFELWYKALDTVSHPLIRIIDWLRTIQAEAEKTIGGPFGHILDPLGMLKKKAKAGGVVSPTTGPQAYMEEGEDIAGKYTPEDEAYARSQGFASAKDYSAFKSMEYTPEYFKKKEPTKKAGAKLAPGTRPETLRAKYGTMMTVPGFTFGEEEGVAPGRGEAARLARAGFLPEQRKRKEEAEERKVLEERYKPVAEKYGKFMADVFGASLEKGGIGAFFKQTALQFASTIVAALAGAAVFQALMSIATAGGSQAATAGAGGFFGTFKKMLGFEQEGTYTNVAGATPMAVWMHPGESIIGEGTIRALAAGLQPRGGRPGYEYGPETYGAGAGGGTNVIVNVKPGVNAEIETYRMAQKGQAIAEGLDG